MNKALRLQRIWKFLCFLVRWPLWVVFGFSCERKELSAPSLVISNHVTNFDPAFVGLCFPKNNMHFVASEHIFRLGWLSKLIDFIDEPIARRKGSKGFDAAMGILRKIRAGHSVCLFAEGETSWDGRSQSIYPATAAIAKACGGNLVTCRIEGGYLTSPRWGKGIRRGRMTCAVVNTYTPAQLKTMTDDEIYQAINADIYEDAYVRQKEWGVRYRSRHTAERLEVGFCLCPQCKKIGTLSGKGRKFTCTCGFEVQLDEYGFFHPATPFTTTREWESWQQEQLLAGSYVHSAEMLFADEGLKLKQILDGHETKEGACGVLSATQSALCFAGQTYPYTDISDMALVTGRKLLFTYQNDYYELSAPKPLCLRKYLTVWKQAAQR